MDQLTDDQIVELQSSIVTEFETVEGEDPTSETVDTMTTLADMLDTVRGEAKRREALAQELTARASEASNRVKFAIEGDQTNPEEMPAEEEGTPAEEDAETPMMEEDEKKMDMPPTMASTVVEEVSELSTEEVPTIVDQTEASASVDTPAAAELAEVSEVAETAELTTTEFAQNEQKDQEAAMTAAAEDGAVELQAPADRRPVQNAASLVSITAGADIPGYTAGSQMQDKNSIAEAMAARLHGLRRVKGGDGEQHIVASITTKFPESRTLTQDVDGNSVKIREAVGPEALVAAGGYSTPYEVKYDIFGIGTNYRPIRDSLPRFAADRGGIRYITPPVLSDYDSAVGIWTVTNDIAATTGTPVKGSLSVTAATEVTAAADAVTLQLKFGNLMTRAYPELIARHNELGLIQHAREAEQQIVTSLTALSTAATTTSLIGFSRDFLVQVGLAAAAYRLRHRLDPSQMLSVIAPAWVKAAIRADLTLSMPGDNSMSVVDSEIEGYLAARDVRVTWSPDIFGTSSSLAAAQGAGALNEFPDTFVWFIFAEGTFLFLDGGTLDIGIIRDSTLVGTNDYRMFLETFEGIAKVGVESVKVLSTINVNGVAAALRDTTGGATAAAIEY